MTYITNSKFFSLSLFFIGIGLLLFLALSTHVFLLLLFIIILSLYFAYRFDIYYKKRQLQKVLDKLNIGFIELHDKKR